MKHILTADWHLTSKQPKCRKDDYHEAQKARLIEIDKIAKDNDASILFAGDMFDRCDDYKAFAIFQQYIPGRMSCICGNHDLPNNDTNQFKLSPIGLVPLVNGRIQVAPSFVTHYGNLYMTHRYVSEKLPPQYIADGVSSEAMIAKAYIANNNVKMVLCGDNHQPFAVSHDGIWCVNPGSTMRFTADQKEHKPRVYIWDTDINHVEPIYLDTYSDVFDTSYLEREKELNERFDRIIDINAVDECDIDFEKNLDMALSNFRREVVKYINDTRRRI